MSLSEDVFLGSVPNNSAVVVRQQNESGAVSSDIPKELLCQSSLLGTGSGSTCNAQWLSPSNSPVGQCVSRSVSESPEEGERGGQEEEKENAAEGGGSSRGEAEEVEGSMFNSARLELGAAGVEEGVYTCVIEDENRVEHKLYVGIYQDGRCIY